MTVTGQHPVNLWSKWYSNRLQGIKPAKLSINQIKQKLVEKLKLSFTPEEWQACLISRIRQGYDSIFCAGTGYRKSLIFEGLAALGGKGRVVIVISPLKALERDQVRGFTSRSILYAKANVLLGRTSLQKRYQGDYDQ